MSNLGEKASIARFIILVASLLTYFGINIPENVIEALTDVVVGLFIIYMAYKNNNLTKEAKQAQEYLDELKEVKKYK